MPALTMSGVLTVAAAVSKREGEWYAEQGIHTICPTRYAIEMFEQALAEV
jgi:hypothetical protein